VCDDGHGSVAIVCTTLSFFVSMTEMVSLNVLATNNAPAGCFSAFFPAAAAPGWTNIAVGCRPTAIDPPGADEFDVSMTLTDPVVDVP
jgi:hypothetical protein